MEIAQQAGFFAAVFGQTPDPMLDAAPRGTLGPGYEVRYEMPGPNNELDELVQHVYPFARPSPVSYTEPDQRFWTTERTRGGWYVATDALKSMLVAAGLPESPPSVGPDDGFGWWPAAGLVAAAVAAAGGLLALVVFLRRRPQTSTVTASRSAS